MKKLVWLFLLVLLLPALSAAGESAADTAEYATHDLVYFTIDLKAADQLSVSERRLNKQIYATIYPACDASADLLPCIQISWLTGDYGKYIFAVGAEAFGQSTAEEVAKELRNQNITATNPQVLSAQFENRTAFFITRTTISTAAGSPETVDMYQAHVYYCFSPSDNWHVTLTAYSQEELDALLPYIDSITFK